MSVCLINRVQKKKWEPVQDMFRAIGQGADLIERTKNFRSRMKKGKPFLTDGEAKRKIETPIDAYVKILGLGHHGIREIDCLSVAAQPDH